MSLWRKGFVAVASVAVLACGSSTPESPLILGADAKDAVPGPRVLTAAQQEALKAAITSSGEPCEAVGRTSLREVGADGQAEAWDVRCVEGAYAVSLFADGTAAHVQRCLWLGNGCSDGFAGRGRRYRQYPDQRGPGELNPDLGKLLEPMTSKDQKVD